MRGGGSNSLGASTGLFGIIGAAIGYIILNWKNMDFVGSPRNSLLCQVAFIIVLSFLLGGDASRTVPHICGFISGIFVGCFYSERFQNPNGMSASLTSYEKTTKNIGMGFTIGLAALAIIISLSN